jgi:Flp pilus assembly protein TadD
LRIVDADFPGSGRAVADSAAKILTILCEDQGFALLREGDPAAAHDLFEAAGELDPKSVTARMGEAFSWRDQGRHDKAEQLFTEALGLGVELDDARRALVHFERARAAADQGGPPDRVRALEDFSAARKLDGENAEIAYEHAHLLFVTGSDADARAALAEVARIVPSIDKQALEDGAKMQQPPDLRTIPGHPDN